MLWYSANEMFTLQADHSVSVDCIAFSRDGQFLAAGGQNGRVKML